MTIKDIKELPNVWMLNSRYGRNKAVYAVENAIKIVNRIEQEHFTKEDPLSVLFVYKNERYRHSTEKRAESIMELLEKIGLRECVTYEVKSIEEMIKETEAADL